MQRDFLNDYFKRIKLPQPQVADAAALRQLQSRHMQAIAFENLNPFLGIPVRLDAATLSHKLIKEGRGGYCYEQNILFMDVLRAMGFQVRGLTGRVYRPDGQVQARTHMLLLVDTDGEKWLADVGFGGLGPSHPLLMQPEAVQETPFGVYKLISGPQNSYTLQWRTQGSWRPLYTFDMQQQYMADFELGNYWTSTHPHANFTRNLMASRHTLDGRYALLNNRFTVYHMHQPEERRILTSPSGIRDVLTEFFQLNLCNLPGLDERLLQLLQREKKISFPDARR